VVRASAWGVKGPRFESHCGRFVYHDGYCDMRLTVPRSTQPCVPLGSLNRVPALAGVTVGMLPLPGGTAFQFGQKKFRFDSILATESIFLDSIRQSDKYAACTLIFK